MDIIRTCGIGTTACTALNVDGTTISDVRIEYTTEYPRPGWACMCTTCSGRCMATSARYTRRSGSVNAQENCD